MASLSLEQLQEQLLEATMPYFASDGWTDHALRQGIRALHLSSAELRQAFPDGARDAVIALSTLGDRKMTEALAQHNLSELRLPKRLELALQLRLSYFEPYRDALRSSGRYLALPSNLALASRLLWQNSDAIWSAVGDRSDDLNYYTKRAQLAPILLLTTCYWLHDSSSGYQNTWDFLRRRLATVAKLGQVLHQCRHSLTYVPSPCRFSRQLRYRGW